MIRSLANRIFQARWLGTAIYGDIVFMFVFAIFMVFLRYDTEKVAIDCRKLSC